MKQALRDLVNAIGFAVGVLLVTAVVVVAIPFIFGLELIDALFRRPRSRIRYRP